MKLNAIIIEKSIAVLFLAIFWFYAFVFLVFGIFEGLDGSASGRTLGNGYFLLCLTTLGLSLFVRRIVFRAKSAGTFPITWFFVFLFYAVNFCIVAFPMRGELLTKYPHEMASAWKRTTESISNLSLVDFDVHGTNLLTGLGLLLFFLWWPLAIATSGIFAIKSWKKGVRTLNWIDGSKNETK